MPASSTTRRRAAPGYGSATSASSSGQKIAYLFDFGDEWRVELTVARVDADDGGAYPRLLESIGEAPPQYPDLEEDVA